MPTDPSLSPLHRDLLADAARRSDHRLTPPERVSGGARRRLGEKLVALSVAETIIGVDPPIWDREPSGQERGLKLTEAGLAIVSSPGEQRSERGPAAAPVEPRAWTKIARVLALLRRGEGADLQTLSSATDWLPHTTRAALTGLRRKGHAILTERRETDGRTVYRIAAEPETTSTATEGSRAASAAPR